MKIIVSVLLFVLSLQAQAPDPNEILEKVREKINKVNDYTAEVDITIDVNFLRVPKTHATIYFKQPDKIKMDSESFALMPRQGLNFSPASLLENDYSAIYVKDDSVGGHPVHLIKVIPLSDTSGVILSNLYIDKDKFIVRKIETTTKTSGTITLNLSYGKQVEFALPSVLEISFKVEQMNLPPGMTGEFDANQETQKREPMTGTVIVEYTDYKVNQGLSDEFFEEGDKE